MRMSFSKLVSTGLFTWHGQAVLLGSDSAEGNGSDLEDRMAELDMDLEDVSSDVAEQNDDEKTVHHLYFTEENATDANEEGSSSNIPDDMSEATTSAPICEPLPSGHIVQVSKQNNDGLESLCSRESKYDVKNPQLEALNQVLGDDMNQLITACRSGDAGVVKRLRENAKADIEINRVCGDSGKTLDDYSSGDDMDEIDEIDRMVTARFNVAIPGGATPLLLACTLGHANVVKELVLFNGIEVNRANNQGVKPIDFGLHHAEVLRVLLLQENIEIDQADDDGWTPLLAASQSGYSESVRQLLQRPEVNVNQQMKSEGNTALLETLKWDAPLACIRALVSHPAIDVNITDNYTETALMRACETCKTDVVRLLLEHPTIDVNMRVSYAGPPPSNQGKTALLFACRDRNTRMGYDEREYTDVVRLLLNHPSVDVKMQNRYGETAVEVASKNGFSEIVQMLTSHLDGVVPDTNFDDLPIGIITRN